MLSFCRNITLCSFEHPVLPFKTLTVCYSHLCQGFGYHRTKTAMFDIRRHKRQVKKNKAIAFFFFLEDLSIP